MKHKPSCAIYDPCPSQCDCCAPTDYQQGFQAGAASRDAYIEQLELALLQVRKAICGDIHNTDDLLDLIANRDAEIAELVAALELLSKYIAYNGDDWVQRTALEALAKVRKP